jgi:hypothetical protein
MRIKDLLLLFMFLVVSTLTACGQRHTVYGIGFYNLENLFDTQHDQGKNDYEFLPDGKSRWTQKRYEHKLHNLAQVLSEMGTDELPGVGCAVIGVAEVENSRCLKDLCNEPALKARNYRFCHVEGPDKRGIDCALLYNPDLFQVRDVHLEPYVYERKSDKGPSTRGFLTVSGTLAGEHLTIIVCHWPSRGSASYYRELAGRQVEVLKDRLQKKDPSVKIIIMGDMNDDPHNKSMAKALGAKRDIRDVNPGGLYNPWWKTLDNGTGTLKYDGAWNLFDQIVVSYNLLPHGDAGDNVKLKLQKHQIFRRDYLFQSKGAYKGSLKRTFGGGNWLDGYSDHLPTVIYLKAEK